MSLIVLMDDFIDGSVLPAVFLKTPARVPLQSKQDLSLSSI